MPCIDKVFVGTDVDIIINPVSGFTDADVSAMSCTLTLMTDATETFTYTIVGGSISIVANVITVHVPKEDITVAGRYRVKLIMTDTGGKVRGLSVCTDPADVEDIDYIIFMD